MRDLRKEQELDKRAEQEQGGLGRQDTQLQNLFQLDSYVITI